MRNGEVVAEFYAFLLSISINHCPIPHCNNSNALSDSLSCSEVNSNKCGSELPTSQKTARTTGLQLISKVVILETVTLSVRANFRHKSYYNIFWSASVSQLQGSGLYFQQATRVYLVRVENLRVSLKHGTPTPNWRHGCSLDISVLATYNTLYGK
jgi:hypothetical protein